MALDSLAFKLSSQAALKQKLTVCLF